MSTKIYEAYRVREGVELWPLLWSIKSRARQEVKAKLWAVCQDVLEGRAQALAEWEEKANADFAAWAADRGIEDRMDMIGAVLDKTWDPVQRIGPKPKAAIAVTDADVRAAAVVGARENMEIFDVATWMHRQYGAQLNTPERNPWTLDVAVTVREADGRFYLIPSCDSASLVAGSLDVLAEMPGLEDFAYWNDTDQPQHVTDEEWDRRGEIWHRLTEHKRWPEFVALEIVSYDSFGTVGPLAVRIDQMEAERDA